MKLAFLCLMVVGSSLANSFHITVSDDGDEISEGPGLGGGPLLVDTSGSSIHRPLVVNRPHQIGLHNDGSWGYPQGG